jgi:type I restriction enzyme R subunit
MVKQFTESVVEEAAIAWLSELGYSCKLGPTIAPGEAAAERESYEQPIIPRRLHDALASLNPNIPADAFQEAFRKIIRAEHPSLIQNNRAFHRILVDGVDVEYLADGRVIHDKAKLADFDDPDNNDWLAVNQYTVVEGQYNRRPDIVLFLNGLPIAVIELKNPADENATIWTAYNQLQTYKLQVPPLFKFN